MDIDKVRALTDTELMAELVTQRRSLYDLRFQLATRQLTDHSQLTLTRRSIARVLTVMTERDIDESKVPTAPAAPAARRSTRSAGTRAKAAAKPAAKTSAKAATKTETKTAAKSDGKSAKAATAAAKGDKK